MVQKIIISDVLKTDLAVGDEKGKYIYSLLKKAFEEKKETIVDFSGITSLTTAFLNYAIGELYLLGNSDELNKYIKIDATTLTISQKKKVRMVMENSKNKISQTEIDEVTIHG